MLIPRHLAAINRSKLSKPAQLCLSKRIFKKDERILDYGCGYGGDVARLRELGYSISGWDPYYFPNEPLKKSSIVCLTYVLNVIEDQVERERTLIKAYKLAKRCLIVSGLVGNISSYDSRLADGILTGSGTFEKYLRSSEWSDYIEDILGIPTLKLGEGIFMVNCQQSRILPFESSRFHLKIALEELLLQEAIILQQGWIPPDSCIIERYSSFNKRKQKFYYYRWRSHKRQLGGGQQCKHIGAAGSPEFQKALEALERRDKIKIIRRRIAKIKERLQQSDKKVA